MSLELKQIKAFVVIAGEGSLKHAAEKLNISQSGLSRLIARLEEQTGAPLFERHSSGVSLSLYGKALMPHALNLLNSADHAQQEIDLLRGSGKGVVRIGAVAGFMGPGLANSIASMRQRHPQVKISLVERVETALFNALLTREIDIAVSGDMPADRGVVPRGLLNCSDDSVIVARPQHPAHRLAQPGLADLLRYDWIMPPEGYSPTLMLNNIYRQHGLTPPESVIETASVVTIKSLLISMDLLTWMPEPLFALEAGSGLLQVLNVPDTRLLRQFMIYTHDGALSWATRQMVMLLKQESARR